MKVVLAITIISSFLLLSLGGLGFNISTGQFCSESILCITGNSFIPQTGFQAADAQKWLYLLSFLATLLVYFLSSNREEYTGMRKTAFVNIVLFLLQGLLFLGKVPLGQFKLFSVFQLLLFLIIVLNLVTLIHRHEFLKVLVAKHGKFQSPFPRESKDLSLYLVIISVLYLAFSSIAELMLGTGSWTLANEQQIKQFGLFVPYVQLFLSIILGLLSLKASPRGFNQVLAGVDKKVIQSKSIILPVLIFIQIIFSKLGQDKEISLLLASVRMGLNVFIIGLAWKQMLFFRNLELLLEGRLIVSKLSDYLSLTKIRLTLLVVFTTSIGLYLSPASISFYQGFGTVLTTFLLVCGSCAMNCYQERFIDGKMARTSDRPLPQGRLDARSAMIFSLVLIFLPLLWQFIYLNIFTFALGLIASLSYIFIYTPLKRYSTVSLFAGAIPGAIPPLIGWAATGAPFSSNVIYLFALMFAWQIPHFLAISILYAKDYADANLKVSSVVFGLRKTVNHIWFSALVLIGLGFAPFVLKNNEDNQAFVLIAGIIAGAFFLLGSYGLLIKGNKISLIKWSRTFFWGTLAYLPAQLLVLAIFL